eukprot:Blabericola_migrator_1__1279@NODE_1330_length_4785_cov_81_161933_g893_i0_p6_GENE_NODE_1330_length_4785_cov_81_161933_g893_i0NODE_1330_length_4785_cov_81_161933_g893_i0_p6_ORF_typecomplete_len111_score11_18_NODE_1330_length_4785_cov_81_161933_g893_i043544686
MDTLTAQRKFGVMRLKQPQSQTWDQSTTALSGRREGDELDEDLVSVPRPTRESRQPRRSSDGLTSLILSRHSEAPRTRWGAASAYPAKPPVVPLYGESVRTAPAQFGGET